MPENEVLDEATETAAVPKGHKAETVTITKAEWERAQRETAEAKQSERYWADRARGSKNEPEEAEEEETIDTSDLIPAKGTGSSDVDEAIYTDPEKWLEAVSKGPKAIQAMVRKATEGFVSAEQVAEIAAKIARRTVDAERGKITTDNKLMTKYPELSDPKSELFKATAEEFNELVAFDPNAKKNPVTLFAAARSAKARLAAAAPKPKRDDDDEYGYERADEDDRRSRIAAQDTTRGGNRLGRGEEAESALGPQARTVIDAMGVKEEAYRASQKSIGASRRKR